MTATRLSAVAAVVAAAALAGGCSAQTVASPGCRSDAVCAPELACVGGSCIPRTTAPAGWGVELEPLSDEQTATLAESMVGGSGALMLTAGSKTAVTGGFVSTASAPVPMAGHVVLTVPAGIPGRPDLQFETDVMVGSVDTASPFFTTSVPDGVLGRTARVTVAPMAPDDQVRAPLTFQVTQLMRELALAVPSRVFKVTGNLYAADGTALQGFLARAFLDGSGQLASNVTLTNGGGGFNLVVPATADVTDPAQTVTVELKPADSSASQPRLSSRHFSLSAAAGDLTLGNLFQPTFANPNVFRFNLRGDSADGPPVADAVIRARTVLANDANGSSDFLRDARTDGDGNADLALLPGISNMSRPYAVAVVPPAGSPYGLLCASSFPLATGGTALAPAHLPVITLPRRPAVTGVVLAADGTPVSGVSITATPLALDAASACAEAAGAPAPAATEDDGTFTLLLDPGSYRFEYDPPRGSPVPRLTEAEVLVSDSVSRVVQMPRGGVVDGMAIRPDGSPLPSAGVRLYEVRCTAGADCSGVARREPILRAQARTDANGHFRAVIPVP